MHQKRIDHKPFSLSAKFQLDRPTSLSAIDRNTKRVTVCYRSTVVRIYRQRRIASRPFSVSANFQPDRATRLPVRAFSRAFRTHRHTEGVQNHLREESWEDFKFSFTQCSKSKCVEKICPYRSIDLTVVHNFGFEKKNFFHEISVLVQKMFRFGVAG